MTADTPSKPNVGHSGAIAGHVRGIGKRLRKASKASPRAAERPVRFDKALSDSGCEDQRSWMSF